MKKVWNICEWDSWLELTCSICSDLRDLGSSPASVKVCQTAPRVTELLELCLWQSWFIFHSDSIYSIKFCHIVVSTMVLIKIEETILCILAGRKRPASTTSTGGGNCKDSALDAPSRDCRQHRFCCSISLSYFFLWSAEFLYWPRRGYEVTSAPPTAHPARRASPFFLPVGGSQVGSKPLGTVQKKVLPPSWLAKNEILTSK